MGHPDYLGAGWSLHGRKGGWIQLGDAAVGADDEGQRESIPVAVVESGPSLAVVAADVGAVGADGDPELKDLGPLNGGAKAVRRGGAGGPVLAAISAEGGCPRTVNRMIVSSSDGDNDGSLYAIFG